MLTCKPAHWVSHKKSFERTYGDWLPKFESEDLCSWKLKIYSCWKRMKCMLEHRIRQCQSFLSKLFYNGKSWLKELYKISRRFGSHFVILLESFHSLPGDSQQNTRRSSGGCQVLLKAFWWGNQNNVLYAFFITSHPSEAEEVSVTTLLCFHRSNLLNLYI